MQTLRRRHVTNDIHDLAPCNSCSEWAWWKPTLFTSQGNRPVEQGESQRLAARQVDEHHNGTPGAFVALADVGFGEHQTTNLN